MHHQKGIDKWVMHDIPNGKTSLKWNPQHCLSIMQSMLDSAEFELSVDS
jgi:hypothetical protein